MNLVTTNKLFTLSRIVVVAAPAFFAAALALPPCSAQQTAPPHNVARPEVLTVPLRGYQSVAGGLSPAKANNRTSNTPVSFTNITPTAATKAPFGSAPVTGASVSKVAPAVVPSTTPVTANTSAQVSNSASSYAAPQNSLSGLQPSPSAFVSGRLESGAGAIPVRMPNVTVSFPPISNSSIVVPAGVAKISLSQRPRVALALGGGGVRGAAHIGVLRALMQAGIPIDMIAGTSMGAIVGGLYSAGIDIAVIEKKFDDGSLMKSFMDVPLKVSIATAPVRAVPRTLSHKSYDGLYTGAKFRKYLDQTVPAYDQYVENFKIPFAAVALDLTDGRAYALTRGKLGAVIQASSAVPELREPVQIGNQLFVDGGVVDNIPVTVARDMGGDIVIAVNVDESFQKAPLSNFKPIGSVARRMMALQLATNDAVQLQLADVVIRPHVDGIGLISTRPRDARQAIRAGEKAAWELIPYIKARLAQNNTALAGSKNIMGGY